MSADDDDFDALARAASQPDSSSIRISAEDRAGAMFEQSVIVKMVAAIEATADFKVLRRLRTHTQVASRFARLLQKSRVLAYPLRAEAPMIADRYTSRQAAECDAVNHCRR